MIGDTVAIKDNEADVMTKFGKAITDISYTINEEEDDGDDNEESDDGDRKLAKKIAREEEAQPTGGRRSGRLAANSSSAHETEGAAERERKQIELMARKNEERLRELARSSKKKSGDSKTRKAEELDAYKDTKNLPDSVLPNQVKVDMANECVILPICGNPVPFHISTIKNVVLPDPDSAAYLRINFYTAGMAVGKDCPENTVKLVQKYAPYATFIREMTFRSLDNHSLTTVRDDSSHAFQWMILLLFCALVVYAGFSANLRTEKACENEGAARSGGGKPCQARSIGSHKK